MAKKKIVKTEVKLVTCLTCIHADLMQWDKDPIIAACKASNEREVAAVKKNCLRYEECKVIPKPIKHIKKYV